MTWDWEPPKRREPREPHPEAVVEPDPSAPLARNDVDPEWDDETLVADHEEYLRFVREMETVWKAILKRRDKH